eukprot:TRINITY_DN10026_c0_g5_i1.p2 TRINITY_DN10026_c0_g5~~TRINITY_DN10026_c0_g5_i1.p2  ORF type:complete len:195 (+),score=83.45 TRINITY_DN10026_c0_g5_i1:110-694(+)
MLPTSPQITILIGANNLCGACKNRSYAEPAFYEQQLELVLSKIHAQLPRSFVNVLPIFNLGQVARLAATSEYCRVVWKTILKTECMCLQGDSTPEDHAIVDARAAEFRARTLSVAAAWEAKALPDFAVRIQPFTSNLTIPSGEFVSKLDCFHPSLISNQAMSLGLWNNLMGSKATGITPTNATFICPTEDTYLQ